MGPKTTLVVKSAVSLERWLQEREDGDQERRSAFHLIRRYMQEEEGTEVDSDPDEENEE
jgi:hypothetical protein